jgi:predicted DNA-binding transcriptional regulator AlpA
MITASSVAALTLKQRGDHIKRRVDRALETFPLLPDEALIEIRTVSALLGRSKASIWRDVATGRLPAPVKVGGSTRWRVGGVRAALGGAGHVG